MSRSNEGRSSDIPCTDTLGTPSAAVATESKPSSIKLINQETKDINVPLSIPSQVLAFQILPGTEPHEAAMFSRVSKGAKTAVENSWKYRKTWKPKNITELTALAPKFSVENNLETLDLSGISIDNPEERCVTDDHLHAVLPHFPNLKNINLSGSKITDVGLAALVHCPKLTSAKFYGCDKIINVAGILPNICPELTAYDLSDCALVGDAAIIDLAKTPITSINMSFSQNYTDVAVKALEKCTKLRDANFAGCPRISNDAILKLHKALPSATIYDWDDMVVGEAKENKKWEDKEKDKIKAKAEKVAEGIMFEVD